MLAILSDEELGDKITMEQYYYNHMNKAQQAAYHSILSGVKNLADEFQIPALEGEELYNVFFQMRLDHPEIFWVSSYKYRYYKNSPNLIFIPEYLFDKKKICEHQKAMTARVEKLIRPAQKLSEWEKEKYVHDFICENIRYDKLKKSYSHEIIGPLGQGVGVCEGIAKAVKVLLDALGVWCVIAICGNNPEKGIKYRHTWNIVKMEVHIIIWMRPLIILWGKIVRLLKSAMIISIWMIHRFSGIMSLLLRRRLTAVIMSTFTIRRRSFLLLRKRMCINVLCRRRRKAGYLFFTGEAVI